MVAATLLALAVLVQKPASCLGVVSTTDSPYCFAAALVDGLAFMARAYTHERDSLEAAVASANLETILRASVYWSLERKRVARRACHDLRAYTLHADSLSPMLPGAFCEVVEQMVYADSVSLADRIADLEGPSRTSVLGRATRDAVRRQAMEETSRNFFLIATGFTHVLLDTSRSGMEGRELRITAAERAALLARLRQIQTEAADGGVYAQAAKTLLDWLANPVWKSKPG